MEGRHLKDVSQVASVEIAAEPGGEISDLEDVGSLSGPHPY